VKRALLLDIGNSRTKAARIERGKLELLEAIPTADLAAGEAKLAQLAGDSEVIAVSSVVPEGLAAVRREITGATVCVAGENLTIPMRVDVEEPSCVGTDRLLGALATWKRFSRAVIVVGFGSALTFDCVDGQGVFLGGLIFPGASMCAEALARGTSALPEVTVSAARPAIGKSTAEAIRTGVFRSIVNAVKGNLAELGDLLGRSFDVIATGGDASVFARQISEIDHVDEALVLRGLDACLKER